MYWGSKSGKFDAIDSFKGSIAKYHATNATSPKPTRRLGPIFPLLL
jgi:hypothetical protein